METLAEEEQSATTDDRSAISLPTEIIEGIFSRLPVKSILRFKSLSKPWLSRISHPSFTKLHFNRPHRSALFISAYDNSTRKQYLLSAAHDGGPVTHIITLDERYRGGSTQAEHLNGLVLFTCVKERLDYWYSYVFVVNPSTYKIFHLSDPYTHGEFHMDYLFGFDESRNEHKILKFSYLGTRGVEIMIFSMSNYSWRKIDAQPPVDILSWDYIRSVCVNSVIHILNPKTYDILGFDLRTEKFSVISTPQGVKSHEAFWGVEILFKVSRSHIIKINGCIGVVCPYGLRESYIIHIWILQDYENRVWVREVITFPKTRNAFDRPLPSPVDSVNVEEIIFTSREYSGNVMRVPVYNKKSRCFRSLQFTSGHQFPLSTTTHFDHLRCYVESMAPL